MNPTEFSPHDHGDDRFVDAALQELARAGSTKEDAPLVKSILLATVDRSPTNITELPKQPREIRSLLIGVGAVAAMVALVVVALQSLPYGNPSRSHSEIQFVVTVTPPPSVGETEATVSSRPVVAGLPYQGGVDVVVSSQVGEDLRSNPLAQMTKEEWTYPLPLAIASLPPNHADPKQETLQIDSDHVRRESDQLVYSGNVELRYRSFLISADTIRLRTEHEAGSSAFLTAENASFSSEEKKAFPVTAAIAGELDIDPVTGIIRLRNIDRLETLENGHISIVDTQEVSITAAGYSIQTRY